MKDGENCLMFFEIKMRKAEKQKKIKKMRSDIFKQEKNKMIR